MVNCNINELSEETRRLHYEVLYRIFKAWLVGETIRLDDIRRELGVNTSRYDKVLDRMELCEDLKWIRCRRGSQGRNRVKCEPTIAGLLALLENREYRAKLKDLIDELKIRGELPPDLFGTLAYLEDIISIIESGITIDIMRMILGIVRTYFLTSSINEGLIKYIISHLDRGWWLMGDAVGKYDKWTIDYFNHLRKKGKLSREFMENYVYSLVRNTLEEIGRSSIDDKLLGELDLKWLWWALRITSDLTEEIIEYFVFKSKRFMRRTLDCLYKMLYKYDYSCVTNSQSSNAQLNPNLEELR
ncbi:hypothetical protein [Vulcanisaeta souniana]|nr:hypothetical protein [Vulcanisaeta souniana]GGI78295.1 hypothetical protein GCM10007112_13890 [Vulcanisaeta souniana JCM 11219]